MHPPFTMTRLCGFCPQGSLVAVQDVIVPPGKPWKINKNPLQPMIRYHFKIFQAYCSYNQEMNNITNIANFRNSGAPLEFKVEAMSLSMFSMCDIVFLFKSHSLLYRKFVHQHNKDHHLFSKEKLIQTCQTCGGTKESN